MSLHELFPWHFNSVFFATDFKNIPRQALFFFCMCFVFLFFSFVAKIRSMRYDCIHTLCLYVYIHYIHGCTYFSLIFVCLHMFFFLYVFFCILFTTVNQSKQTLSQKQNKNTIKKIKQNKHKTTNLLSLQKTLHVVTSGPQTKVVSLQELASIFHCFFFWFFFFVRVCVCFFFVCRFFFFFVFFCNFAILREKAQKW